MKSLADMSLGELAAFVWTHLHRHGINCVLSAVTVVFFLLTAPVIARWSHIYPPKCTAEWCDLVCDSTKAFVCPSGDGSSLHVVLKDYWNTPMAYLLITATFTSGCNVCLCSPVQGTTDVNGEVNLTIRGGLDASYPPQENPCSNDNTSS